jgi:polyphosphate kinase
VAHETRDRLWHSHVQVPGDNEHPGTSFGNDIRICFAVRIAHLKQKDEALTNHQWEDEDVLAEGISRLATVISKMQDESYEHVAKPVATEAQAKTFW